MDIIKKINYIIDSFIKEDARLWEIGTDFYSTWTKFHKNIKAVYNFENPQLNNLFFQIKQSNKERFQIIFNNQNITPINKKVKEASKSAIRQYFQIGHALHFIDFPEKTKIEDNKKITIINKSFSRFLSQENPNDLLSKFFLDGLLTWWNDNIGYIRNLYFSILISLIDEYNYELFFKLEDYKIKMIQKSKKFGDIGTLHSPKFILIIKKTKGSISIKPEEFNNLDESLFSIDGKFNFELFEKNSKKYISQNGKNTYTQIAKKLIDNYNFEDIINKLYEQIINPGSDNYIPKKTTKENNSLMNYFEELESKRKLLRENIILKRFLYKDNNSDLEGSIENSGNNEYIQLMEACHIYDVQYIKEDLENIFDKYFENDKDLFDEEYNKLKDIIQDDDNGILMNKCCHSLFDKSYVWFDNNGKLQWQKEKEELVKRSFGNHLNEIKIKSSVFNEKMKEYMFKRITVRKI